MEYHTASVCIPPSYVSQVKEYVKNHYGRLHGYRLSNGYNTTKVKEYETADALEQGADEIDMVINLGWMKDKKYDLIEQEIKALKMICGDKILKVIIETCLLTDEEKIKMCEIVTGRGRFHQDFHRIFHRRSNL